ncbi:MAG: hypothetical protein LBV33_00810 [Lachnospiraceae bacterium]|jgi:hypothetical protein|nr:hypothetical protein [Lachnospiraceae bacterium]
MDDQYIRFSIPLMEDKNARPIAMLPIAAFLSAEIQKTMDEAILQKLMLHKIPVLIDTGAVIPIWTGSKSVLESFGAQFYKAGVPVSGFGGGTVGDAYNLPNLTIDRLSYRDIKIVACAELGVVPFFMIISATMFRGLAYEVDIMKFNLNIRMNPGDSYARKLKVFNKADDTFTNLSLFND